MVKGDRIARSIGGRHRKQTRNRFYGALKGDERIAELQIRGRKISAAPLDHLSVKLRRFFLSTVFARRPRALQKIISPLVNRERKLEQRRGSGAPDGWPHAVAARLQGVRRSRRNYCTRTLILG